MKRILYVLGSSNVGGAEKQCIELFKLVRQEYEARLLILGNGGNLRDFITSTKDVEFSRGGILNDILLLIRTHLEFRPDIQVNWLYKADILGGIVGRLFKVEVNIGSARNTNWPKFNKIKKWVIVWNSRKNLHLIVANSKASKFWHADIGIPQEKMVVIKNFLLDTENIKLVNRNLKEGLKIGIASRPVIGKGHDLLFKAANSLKDQGFDITLYFIGYGVDTWLYLKELQNKHGVKTIVSKGASNMKDWYEQIDIYCCISDSWESDSNALLEATLNCKTTIISNLIQVDDLVPPPRKLLSNSAEELEEILSDIINHGGDDESVLESRKNHLIAQRQKVDILDMWKNILNQ